MSEQLSLELATRWGERQIRHAQVLAENLVPGFTSRAATVILQYLREHGPTPGEALTDVAKGCGVLPPDDRAFGAVFKLLVRRGAITQSGWTTRRKGHGTGGGRVWAAR